MAEKSSVPVKSEDKAVRRWDPFERVQALQEEMAHLFEDTWPFIGRQRTWPALRPTSNQLSFAPRMDVYEKNGKLVIKTDLPGMKVNDVQVTIEDGDLIITGERKAEKEVNDQDYHRMERSYGSFYRRQPLPEGTTPDKIQATFADGVLEVTVPKPVEQKTEAQKIPITTK